MSFCNVWRLTAGIPSTWSGADVCQEPFSVLRTKEFLVSPPTMLFIKPTPYVAPRQLCTSISFQLLHLKIIASKWVLALKLNVLRIAFYCHTLPGFWLESIPLTRCFTFCCDLFISSTHLCAWRIDAGELLVASDSDDWGKTLNRLFGLLNYVLDVFFVSSKGWHGPLSSWRILFDESLFAEVSCTRFNCDAGKVVMMYWLSKLVIFADPGVITDTYSK